MKAAAARGARATSAAASLALAPLEGVTRATRMLDGFLWEARTGRVRLLVADDIPSFDGPALFELDLLPVEGCPGPAALCFDYGEGFDEASAVALSRSALSPRSCSALVELRSPPTRIRVDACAGAGRFFCSELRVAPVGPRPSSDKPPRVGAILHLSHGDLWPQMAQYLSHIAALQRLYMSLPEDTSSTVREEIAARYPRAVVRRLAPGESGAAASLRMVDLAADHGVDLVCLLHTRASAHVGGTDAGRWDMTHKLAGSPEIVADILASFEADPRLGMVGPAGHVLPAAWQPAVDAERLREGIARLGCDAGVVDSDFVAGSMCWARIDVLRSLRRLGERMESLDAAPPAQAGALERCLRAALAVRGLRLAETRVAGPATQSALDFAPLSLPASGSGTAAGTSAPVDEGTEPVIVLTPLRGLKPVAAPAGIWEATDNDAQFLVEGLAAHTERWVLIRTDLAAPYSAQPPTIHFDFGAGWTLTGAQKLVRPAEGGGIIETVCWIPAGFVRARFDPTSHPGRFALDHFEARPLTVVRAIEGMRIALASAGERDPPVNLERLFPAYGAMLEQFDASYANWIRRYEMPRENYELLARAQAAWPDPPSVSMVVHAPAASLGPLLESLRGQLYPHWELWIAGSGPVPDADARVRTLGDPGESLAAAANAALERASGALFAVLDEATILHPLALHYVAQAALSSPSCALVFTDEDRIAPDGTRRDPWFKPELNEELLLAGNMVSRLACYRTEVVRDAGGLREGLEGAEGYDLVLRVTEGIDRARVLHVPRVLCHVREKTTSRAADGGASRKAVAEHLARIGVEAEVLPAPGAPPSMHRVRFAIARPAPEVAIIIPTRDRADLLRTCVDAITTRTAYPSYRIVIVDNGSTEDDTGELLRQYRARGITVIRDDGEFNFSALNNRAVAAVTSDFICLMNNDVEVLTEDWLEEMVGMAARAGVGAVGARLWYPDRRLQHGGLVLGIAGVAGYPHKLLPAGEPGYACRAILHQSFSAVTAACLVVRKAAYEEVGGLDENLPVAFNDVDFCLRLRDAGYRSVWTPYAEMIHDESSTRGPESTPEKARRFQHDIDLMRDRCGARLYADPAYSPNLTLDAEDFSLAWPPRTAASPIIGESMHVPRSAR